MFVKNYFLIFLYYYIEKLIWSIKVEIYTTNTGLKEFEYKQKLKKDMNKAGGFLLTNHIVMYIIAYALIIGLSIFNTKEMSSSLLMLENGLISIMAFFLCGVIYCAICRIRLTEIIRFEKNKISLLVPLCLMALSIAMVSNFFSQAVMGIFDMFGVDASSDVDFSYNGVYDILIFYISVAIVPALVEEFAFRGIVLGVLRKHSDSLAILVSSVMFGLMHGNFMQIPFAVVVGLILGYITVKTNSMLPGIIVHFLNNAISVTFSLLSENKNISTELINLIYVLIMLVVMISGIISFYVLVKKHKGLFKLGSQDNIIPFKSKVKIFVTSPTMIIFTILIIYEAIFALIVG